MLFKKLFQTLVLGGAVIGTTSGCVQRAQAESAPSKDTHHDGGTASDAGVEDEKTGTGVKGW
jgi:hypothetical protein